MTAGVAKLAKLPLKSLNVNYCTSISDKAMKSLGRDVDARVDPDGLHQAE